jgi:hypothetical protein
MADVQPHGSRDGLPDGFLGQIARLSIVGALVGLCLYLSYFVTSRADEHAQRIELAVRGLEATVQAMRVELQQWRVTGRP